jgi:hypothetical protein
VKDQVGVQELMQELVRILAQAQDRAQDQVRALGLALALVEDLQQVVGLEQVQEMSLVGALAREKARAQAHFAAQAQVRVPPLVQDQEV